MKKPIHLILVIILLSLFSGWADPIDSLGGVDNKIIKKTSEKTQNIRSVFKASDYLKKADIFRKNDDLHLALFFLKVAAALSPDSIETAEKLSDLKRIIDRKSKKYFKEGNKLYHQKKFKEARNSFLTALRYNPDYKDALDYLKIRLIPKECIYYTFEKNDSLKTISTKFYENPEWVFLIEYFNNLKSNIEPKPGDILKIPKLEPEFSQIMDDRRQDMISAKNLMDKKQFQEVIILTKTILANDPLNQEAVQLKNDAYYQIGIHLRRQGKNFEAIDTLKKIAPEREDANGLIQEAMGHELLKAEFFLKKMKYEESMSIAKKILSYDPSNTAAKNLISTSFCQKGKDLFKRKKYDEALRVLNKADPSNSCSNRMRLAIQKAKKHQAEMHYIQGVKYFLNEELQHAIKEWEKALKLNPKHDKAKKNIKNAKSLLEKLNRVK